MAEGPSSRKASLMGAVRDDEAKERDEMSRRKATKCSQARLKEGSVNGGSKNKHDDVTPTNRRRVELTESSGDGDGDLRSRNSIDRSVYSLLNYLCSSLRIPDGNQWGGGRQQQKLGPKALERGRSQPCPFPTPSPRSLSVNRAVSSLTMTDRTNLKRSHKADRRLIDPASLDCSSDRNQPRALPKPKAQPATLLLLL
ncbi:MAG: hypothetical protein Q9196_001946 [Gyalolechia fulgens]